MGKGHECIPSGGPTRWTDPRQPTRCGDCAPRRDTRATTLLHKRVDHDGWTMTGTADLGCLDLPLSCDPPGTVV